MMKTLILLAASVLMCGSLRAEYRQWTNAEGKSAELELFDIVQKDGEKAGRFRMKDGRVVTLKVSMLAPEDAKALDSWVAPGRSVFEKILEDNLVKLEGKTLAP
ncbi:MAG TPA: hypothetical protein VFY13_00235, partial [Luteolibacter sp.]|nr:hypothetical protein [Luteolibacter sp.]